MTSHAQFGQTILTPTDLRDAAHALQAQQPVGDAQAALIDRLRDAADWLERKDAG